MGGVGSSRDVSSSREAKRVLGLDETFPRVRHHLHSSTDRVIPMAPSLWMN